MPLNFGPMSSGLFIEVRWEEQKEPTKQTSRILWNYLVSQNWGGREKNGHLILNPMRKHIPIAEKVRCYDVLFSIKKSKVVDLFLDRAVHKVAAHLDLDHCKSSSCSRQCLFYSSRNSANHHQFLPTFLFFSFFSRRSFISCLRLCSNRDWSFSPPPCMYLLTS